MQSLLEQFNQETREFLQNISEQLIQLESAPDDKNLINELFRSVHTLKGNSGLFDFPTMTRVLHAGEDLMDSVRDGQIALKQDLVDLLLEVVDFISLLTDEIETTGSISADQIVPSEKLTNALRALLPQSESAVSEDSQNDTQIDNKMISYHDASALLKNVPELLRLRAWESIAQGNPLHLIHYQPDPECFYKGEDPVHIAKNVPEYLWFTVLAPKSWPNDVEYDCYKCQVELRILSLAPEQEIRDLFRYTPEQITLHRLDPLHLIQPTGDMDDDPVNQDFVEEASVLLESQQMIELASAASSLSKLSAPHLWTSSLLRWLLAIIKHDPTPQVIKQLIDAIPHQQLDILNSSVEQEKITGANPLKSGVKDSLPADKDGMPVSKTMQVTLLEAQQSVLNLPSDSPGFIGRMKGVAATLKALALNPEKYEITIDAALEKSIEELSSTPLKDILDTVISAVSATPSNSTSTAAPSTQTEPDKQATSQETKPFSARGEDASVGKIIKVEQEKIDRLMNLIGEMVVAKNALPYIAKRAQDDNASVQTMSRDIKTQYGIINRIVEEMQDAIMQVRMMPISNVFQRFPRLVRDISRKLDKEVNLILEGEETEADKNIIGILSDPLIHIVRNSLDHGLESSLEREAAGKPTKGTLTLRASQDSDKVLIEIIDDGKGINPVVIKTKALEKGIITQEDAERMSDQEAVNLVFAAGFSTAETVSDLSGRGVGMDVVRNSIETVGGSISLQSDLGVGTRLKLSLPLSMAISNVMVIETNTRLFGFPLSSIVETVRVDEVQVKSIKGVKTIVLRDRVIPLFSLNGLLNLPQPQRNNEDNECAILIMQIGIEQIGLLVDDFREVIDVILKPLPGELGKLNCYAGSTLLGDGSVLMVINPKGLFV